MMSQAARTKVSESTYTVGYGRPPMATRFRKGQSGNPRGRPPGHPRDRARGIIERELYRPLILKEGDRTVRMPALQAVVRCVTTAAVKGSGPAQHMVFRLAREVESDQPARAEPGAAPPSAKPVSDLEVARRIAFVLSRGGRALNKERGESRRSDDP